MTAPLCLNDKINLKEINIKKPNSLSIHNIYYNNEILFIQTPISLISYHPNIYENGYTSIILNIDSSFQKYLNDVLISIHERISKIYKISAYVSLNDKLKLLNMNHNTIGVFDRNNKKTPLLHISKYDKVLAIFQIESYQDPSFILKLIQLKKLDTLISPETPLFIEKHTTLVPSPPPPPPRPPPPPPTINFNKISKVLDEKIIKTASLSSPPKLEEILAMKSNLKKIIK